MIWFSLHSLFIAKQLLAVLALVVLLSAMACQDQSPTSTPDTQATIAAGVNATIAAIPTATPTSTPTPTSNAYAYQHLNPYT